MKTKKWVIEKTRPKGGLSQVDLKETVRDLRLTKDGLLQMTIFNGSGKTVRPQDVLKEVFKMEEVALRKARIVKHADGER